MRKTLVFLVLIFLLSSCSFSKDKSQIIRRKDTNNIVNISSEAIKNIGIMVEPAEIKKVNFHLRYNGIVKSIPSKTFYIASPVKGKILEVFVEPNQIINSSTNSLRLG
ncbi:MAG: lipoprotein [Candidatus Melainabacteria bacterium]|nr:lipoprotein [Candidatus Melainabacteria bacterium]